MTYAFFLWYQPIDGRMPLGSGSEVYDCEQLRLWQAISLEASRCNLEQEDRMLYLLSH